MASTQAGTTLSEIEKRRCLDGASHQHVTTTGRRREIKENLVTKEEAEDVKIDRKKLKFQDISTSMCARIEEMKDVKGENRAWG